MGSVIDTLTVLINGDAKGIEATMKQAVSYATGAVNSINKQEVDWTSIFSRTVSPAIIEGVASMFAFAIEQSLQFQQALNTAGTAAGESSSQIAQTGQSALGLSTQVTSSASDIANAMLQVSSTFGTNTDATNQVVAAMSQLADSGFGNLNDIVSTSMELFKQWGVTTSSQAVSVLTSLMHGAEAAKESIPSLGQQFLELTPSFITAGLKLNDFNTILSGFSAEIQTVGQADATAVFNELAKGANDAGQPMAYLTGGVEAVRKSLKDNGGLSAIQTLASVFSSRWSDDVGMIAAKLGLSQQSISGIITSGRDFPTLATNEKAVATNAQSIADAFSEADTSIKDLMKILNTMKAIAIDVGGIIPFQSLLKTILQDLQGVQDLFVHFNLGNFGKLLSALGIGGTTIGGAAAGGTLGAEIGAIGGPLGALIGGGIGGLIGGVGGALGGASIQNQATTNTNSILFNNNFHLSVPTTQAGTPAAAKTIANQIYQMFQGIL